MRRWAVVPLALALAAGCGGNESSPYPPGLAPLDPQLQAQFPSPVDGDPDPEQLNLVSGSTSGYVWVHGAAFVHGTLDVVWAAMRDPDVCADRRQLSSYTVTLDDEPQYDYSYVIHNTVNASVVTIQFDNSWRHDALVGTKDQPQAVVAGYQKTYGTDFISVLAGSFVARQLDDGNTSLELIEHLQASGQGASTAESTLTDYYQSILARVKMQPLPTY